MIEIIYSDKFLSEARKLTSTNQIKLAKLLDLLKSDPFYPLLHSKKLSGKLNYFYSFLINRDWRTIFVFEDKNTIKLVKIGNRKDIYKK